MTDNQPRKFWTRTKVLVSAAIGLLSAVTAVMSIYQFVSRDPSNFSHLRISATPFEDGVREWAIPPQALDIDFPNDTSSSTVCGPEQLTWLETNGSPLDRRFQIDMRNTAKEGPILALIDFRTTSEPPESRGEPQIRIRCGQSTQQPETIYFERFDADNPDAFARHVKIASKGLEQTPSFPSAYNLAPGASEQAIFELFSRYPASGTISVTTLSGEEERVTEITGSDFSLPPLLFSGELYLVVGAEGLSCQRLDSGYIQACTLDDVRKESAAALR